MAGTAGQGGGELRRPRLAGLPGQGINQVERYAFKDSFRYRNGLEGLRSGMGAAKEFQGGIVEGLDSDRYPVHPGSPEIVEFLRFHR